MKNLLYIAILACLLAGCKKFDDPAAWTPYEQDPSWTMKTIAELKALYDDSGPTTITEDYTVKGTVISTDFSGSNYNNLWIQDATGGLCIKIGLADYYLPYDLGRIVYIKVRGLVLGLAGGQVELGCADAQYATGYIEPQSWIDRVILRGDMDPAPPHLNPAVISTSADLAANVGKFVKMSGVTWTGVSNPAGVVTWADPTATGYTEQNFKFTGSSSSNFVVRTSVYASFALGLVPIEICDMTGILNKYNSTYQVSLNSATDVVEQ